ncbi:MAG TPA: hypothetical protein VGX68_15905 [Thermoanaerobaculia bacterium]|jgi:hypothetical protein|nr:hypothetical protein [Thermoanaerobaculia bacterium]
MSGSIVRRLTAAVVLAAVLCAAPALAAPGGRPVSPVVLGPGLFDQLLAWVGSLWHGVARQDQAEMEKSGPPVSGSGAESSSHDPSFQCDGSVTIDPNGGSK